MASKKIQLYTDRANTIEASPETSANCVILSDGNDLQKVLDNDLTNPTVVHEETSFKVGVGDIDVSSSVVDGEVGRMVVKGKTYQNILPEPSTHVLTNNKEMFKVNEGLDPNVEIVDAVSKSAILTGQTLVNLITSDTIVNKEGGSATFINNKLRVKFANYNWSGIVIKNTGMFKPSTKYTIIAKATNTTAFTIEIGHNSTSYNTFTPINDSRMVLQSGETGSLKIALTTRDNLQIGGNVYNVMASQNPSSFSGDKFIDVELMIIEGDYTNVNIPYFEGMQSVKMPVLSTVGKNVVNEKIWKIEAEEEGYQCLLSAGWATEVDKSGNPIIIPVHVEKDKVYTLKCKNKATKHFNDFYFMDDLLNGKVKSFRRSVGKNTTLNSFVDTIITFTADRDYKYLQIDTGNSDANGYIVKNTLQLEEGSIATPYEPYKTNILHAPEEVVLRKVNGVEDTLNLNTGEYVQRTKEIVLNGSENWGLNKSLGDGSFYQFVVNIVQAKKVTQQLVVCDKLVSAPNESINNRIWIYDGTTMVIHSSCRNVDEMKTWLQQNPLTVQYELATPIVKTVDLSSSGNWEKIVLNGSENWTQSTANNNYFMETSVIKSNYNTGTENLVFSGDHRLSVAKIYTSNTNTGLCIEKGGGLRIRTQQVLGGQSIEDFKVYLSQNPVMVYYQTKNHQDSTQVKQPIFFKDGHIQLSSGADNSLIPTLDYQAKTSNSYVMDLMKTNTRYTMKAKSASGTFTIDGTSYGAGTNGTFTTPTSLTNKLLVMSNKTNEEVMILEGDVTSKTTPYFKGIKSAFEGEDKIEVLSTGKNLITDVSLRKINGAIWDGDVLAYSGTTNDLYYTHSRTEMTHESAIKVKVGSYYEVGLEVFSGEVNVGYSVAVATFDKDLNVVRWLGNRFVVQQGEEYVGSIRLHGVNAVWTNIKFRMWMEEVDASSNVGAYEPYKSNNTKIPLLSPLRSLPNGVCDELIIDRMKKKATLIQRVGKVVLNGSENWTQSQIRDKHYVVMLNRCSEVGIPEKYPSTLLCSHFINQQPYAYDREGINIHVNYNFHIGFLKNRLSEVSVGSCKKWLSQNPVTVYYESATPVITEVDLENFPLVYKDGRIFLNSEIAPVVEIDYNINQAQLIIGNGETLLRHEQEILDLDKLIVSFVDCEYRLRLLKFDMELSMIALAE